MSVLPIRIGFPVAKIRLVGAVITAVFFGFLLYEASFNLKWLSFNTEFYLFLGIAEGLLLGAYEVRVVTSKLAEDTEVFVWQMIPLSTALLEIPFLLVTLAYGFSEYSAFLVHVVLSGIPAFLATSGWYYSKFEKQNNIQILSSPYRFNYWKEPIANYSDQFNYFLREIQMKDASTMWQQIGYCKIYLKELEKRQDLAPEVQESLHKILDFFNSYRIRGLAVLAVIIIVFPFLLIFSFTNGFGILKTPLAVIMDVTMPLAGVLFVILLSSTFYLMQSFKKQMSKILSQVDSDKLYSS